MKTLDEVIDQLIDCHTNWARWSQTSDIVDRSAVEDAINYLKEYRLDKQIFAYDIARRNFEVAERNDPLSWDELKQMEGKPVWVEVDGKWYGKFWAFVEVGNDAYVNFYQKGQEYPEDLWKCNMGKTWNAYRKERE